MRGVAILVDPPKWWFRERWWGHVVSDTSFDELHEFAARLGYPRRAFDRDHYDLPEERLQTAIEAGAVLVTSRELMTRLRAAGLRRRREP